MTITAITIISLTILALIVFLPLFAGIPVVFATVRLPGQFEFETIALDHVPGMVHGYARPHRQRLVELGFELKEVYLQRRGASKSQRIYILHHVDEKSLISAGIIFIEQTLVQKGYVEVASERRDGVFVSTANADEDLFGYPSELLIERHPKAATVDALLDIHKRRIAEMVPNDLVEIDASKFPERAREINRRILDYQVERGLFRYDPQREVFAPTVKGALFMTAKTWATFRHLKFWKVGSPS